MRSSSRTPRDRKSTRLNSSHPSISYAVFCLKKKTDIDSALALHRGDNFDEDQYEKSKEQLVDQLKHRGFAEAQVSGQVRVAPEDATAFITYNFFFNDTATTEIYTLSLHDALPI